jgi:hypothetical protein
MRNRIEKFKNKYSGERCFLVGNGPSLAHTPLELLKEEYTFGVNKIADIYPMTTWRPSFYVMVSVGVRLYPDLMDAARVSIKDTVSFICWDNLQPLLGAYKMQVPGTGQVDVCRVPPNVYPVRVTFEHHIPRIDPNVWSHDIAKSVSKDGSSMFAVMQIAVYMGFNPLILIGCDLGHKAFVWGDQDPNHFSGGYSGKPKHKTGKPFRFTAKRAKEADAYMLSGHATAKEVCDKIGVEIYNATVGGELETYPRIDFVEAISGLD